MKIVVIALRLRDDCAENSLNGYPTLKFRLARKLSVIMTSPQFAHKLLLTFKTLTTPGKNTDSEEMQGEGGIQQVLSFEFMEYRRISNLLNCGIYNW